MIPLSHSHYWFFSGGRNDSYPNKEEKKTQQIYYLSNEKYYGVLRTIFTCDLWIQGDYGVTLQSGRVKKNVPMSTEVVKGGLDILQM